MHFHSWVEFKEIKDGAVTYYRVCKKCAKCQKWLGGGYWDCKVKKEDVLNWEFVSDDDDFRIDFE